MGYIKGRQVKCPDCDKIFSSAGNVSNHRKVAHKGVQYQCKICQRQFTTLQSLQDHSRKGVCVKNKCEDCNQCFKTFPLLKAHRDQEHKGSKVKVFKCKFCFVTRSSRKTLKAHIVAVHEKTTTLTSIQNSTVKQEDPERIIEDNENTSGIMIVDQRSISNVEFENMPCSSTMKLVSINFSS